MDCNYVFSIGQGVDQMGKVYKKWLKEQLQENQKRMCHFAIMLEIIFQKWFRLIGRATREKEVGRAIGEKEVSRATWEYEKNRKFERKVYQEQKTSKPYTHLS